MDTDGDLLDSSVRGLLHETVPDAKQTLVVCFRWSCVEGALLHGFHYGLPFWYHCALPMGNSAEISGDSVDNFCDFVVRL